MTVRMHNGVIELAGACGVKEAEQLSSFLLASEAACIDASRCDAIHAAVAQAIMAFRPVVQSLPADPFLRGLFRQIARAQ